MSQLTHPGPAVKESLRARSVAPPASRPGPTRHHGHRHDSVAEPLPFSWVPWQQEGLVLNETDENCFGFYIYDLYVVDSDNILILFLFLMI